MEVAGLSVGILGLASLFNNAVNCFEYVHLGKSIGRDFQTSQLKLDNARLRLSRWGQSVGLSGDVRDIQTLNQTFASTQTLEKAKERLEQIQDLIDEAERTSNKYKSRAQNASIVVYNAQTDLESGPASLHEKLRQFSIKRQNRTPLRQKASWAIYEEKRFNRLIEDTTDLVDGLEKLFPTMQASRQELCEIEVSEVGKDEELSMLREIAASVDKSLAEAINKVTGRRSGDSYNVDFSGSTNYGQQMGHYSGTGTQYNTFGGAPR